MKRRDIVINLEKLNTKYKLQDPVTQADIDQVSSLLSIEFPYKTLQYYSEYNGLRVDKSQFRIFPLQELHWFKESSLLAFCSIGEVTLCFETKRINSADQWDIVEPETGYIVTHTMASFLTMQIWKWLRHSREIWKEEVFY